MTVTTICFFGAVAVLMVLIVRQQRADRERVRQSRQRTGERHMAESHQSSLPMLRTDLLLRIPFGFMQKTYGSSRKAITRTFGIRERWLVVIDELGYGWIGFLMPQTLESLWDSEFELLGHFVPLRGEKQSYAGDPIPGPGRTLTVYPLWFTPGSVPDADLWKWSDLEEAFEQQYGHGGGWEADRQKYLPAAHLQRVSGLRIRRQEIERYKDK